MNSYYSKNDAVRAFHAYREARQKEIAGLAQSPPSKPRLIGRLACIVLGHHWNIPRKRVITPVGGWAPLPVLRCSRCHKAWSIELMEET